MKNKKKFLIISVIMILLFVVIWKLRESNYKDTYFYYGQGDTWMATYTVSEINSTYYETIYIQYLYDSDISERQLEKISKEIGAIEYRLIGNSQEISSAFPQELNVYLNYQHAKFIKVDQEYKTERTMNITINWQDKEENITLKRQN